MMDSPVRTFLKFSFGTGLNAVFSAISIPIITWFIVPAELGKGTMFTLAYNLLLNIFMLGQDQSFARHFNEVTKDNRPKLLFSTFSSSVCACLLGILIIELFRSDISQLLFSNDIYTNYVDMLSVMVLCGIMSRFTQLIVRMQNKAIMYSLLQVILTSSNLLLTIGYAVYVKNDFTAIIVASVVSQILCLAVGVILEIRFWRECIRAIPSLKEIKTQLYFGLPFVPTFVFDWVFQSTDRTFLRLFSTYFQVGIYSTATRISGSLNILQTGFNTFWTPFVYEKFSLNDEDKKFYQPVFESIYLSFSFAILLLLSVKDFIALVLPAEYRQSIAIFPLLLFVPMLYTLSEITCVGINLKKKTVFHFYILASCALISVVLGYFLIREYGARGAIFVNFLSYSCFFTMRSMLGQKLYSFELNWSRFLITIVLVLIPVAYLYILPDSQVLVLILITATAIYLLHIKSIKNILNRVINRNGRYRKIED